MELNPHPTDREKSLPVPIGKIPILILLKLIPAYIAENNTHGIVPSPPQIINLTSFFNC